MKIYQIALILLITKLTLTCPGNDPYCAACNGSFCEVCYGGALNYQGKCQSVQKIMNCFTYNLNGSCKFCLPGYVVSSRGDCQKISIANCAEVSGNRCVMCLNGILIQGGQCNPLYKCSTNCRACKLQNGMETCARCGYGYALKVYSNTNRCERETTKTANCLYLNGTSSCAVCDVNYYWKNATCQRSMVQNISLYAPLISKYLAFFFVLLNLK